MTLQTTDCAADQPLTFQPRAACGTASAQHERWALADVEALFELPFPELIHRAQTVHREHHDPARIELAKLGMTATKALAQD